MCIRDRYIRDSCVVCSFTIGFRSPKLLFFTVTTKESRNFSTSVLTFCKNLYRPTCPRPTCLVPFVIPQESVLSYLPSSYMPRLTCHSAGICTVPLAFVPHASTHLSFRRNLYRPTCPRPTCLVPLVIPQESVPSHMPSSHMPRPTCHSAGICTVPLALVPLASSHLSFRRNLYRPTCLVPLAIPSESVPVSFPYICLPIKRVQIPTEWQVGRGQVGRYRFLRNDKWDEASGTRACGTVQIPAEWQVGRGQAGRSM